jgi:3-oxoacyl-[acyl-carrier protein] reductase
MLTLNLTGKIAVVTGATGQLGRVMVRTLAECGADVAIHYLQNADKAAALKAEVEGMGRRAVTMQSPEAYESQFQSSVLHNVLMAQAFVPDMIALGKGGRVIGINTECAMQNFPTQSAYVAGKRGMDGVLRILAKEVGTHGITVNQVAPGWTISDNDRASGSESQPDYEKSVPLGRRGTDQEIANVVAFLASDLSSYITGVYVPVCGGNVMPAI